MPSWGKWGRDTLSKAGKTALKIADRADERGGELRDQLKQRIKSSTRLQQVKHKVDSLQSALATATETPQVAPPASGDAVQTSQGDVSGSSKQAQQSFSFGDARHAAQVFGSRSCPWSGRALRLFEAAGVEVRYLDLDHPASASLRNELEAETGQLTVPFIYLRGEFIGGFNALDEISRLGQLPYRLLDVEERKKHPDHGKIEVVARKKAVDALQRPPQ